MPLFALHSICPVRDNRRTCLIPEASATLGKLLLVLQGRMPNWNVCCKCPYLRRPWCMPCSTSVSQLISNLPCGRSLVNTKRAHLAPSSRTQERPAASARSPPIARSMCRQCDELASKALSLLRQLACMMQFRAQSRSPCRAAVLNMPSSCPEHEPDMPSWKPPGSGIWAASDALPLLAAPAAVVTLAHTLNETSPSQDLPTRHLPAVVRSVRMPPLYRRCQPADDHLQCV